MVRANYNDLKNGIHQTTEYLVLFLNNLLLGHHHILQNRTMHISGMFKISNKQDIGSLKQDIQIEKQDIQLKHRLEYEAFSKKTVQNALRLFQEFGFEIIFSRKDVMKILNLTESSSSTLIKRLRELDVIEPVKGGGKGKYRFKTTIDK